MHLGLTSARPTYGYKYCSTHLSHTTIHYIPSDDLALTLASTRNQAHEPRTPRHSTYRPTATMVMVPQKKSHLLHLPAELREMIYRFRFFGNTVDENDIDVAALVTLLMLHPSLRLEICNRRFHNKTFVLPSPSATDLLRYLLRYGEERTVRSIPRFALDAQCIVGESSDCRRLVTALTSLPHKNSLEIRAKLDCVVVPPSNDPIDDADSLHLFDAVKNALLLSDSIITAKVKDRCRKIEVRDPVFQRYVYQDQRRNNRADEARFVRFRSEQEYMQLSRRCRHIRERNGKLARVLRGGKEETKEEVMISRWRDGADCLVENDEVNNFQDLAYGLYQYLWN